MLQEIGELMRTIDALFSLRGTEGNVPIIIKCTLMPNFRSLPLLSMDYELKDELRTHKRGSGSGGYVLISDGFFISSVYWCILYYCHIHALCRPPEYSFHFVLFHIF